MEKSYDVIVIGAGIVGVSTALHLQRKGKNVLLLDKQGAGQGTSFGNAGVVDASYVTPFLPPPLRDLPEILLGHKPAARSNIAYAIQNFSWIVQYYKESSYEKRYENATSLRPLTSNSVKEHQDIIHQTDAEKYFVKSGRVKIFRSLESFEKASEERHFFDRFGVTYDVLTAEEFKEVEPDINPVFSRAVLSPLSSRYTNPCRAVEALVEHFQKNNGDFLVAEVREIKGQRGGWDVNTPDKLYHAENIVLCTGPWANDLLNPLDHKFPMLMKRGYHKHFQTDANISHAIVDADIGYLLSSMDTDVRLTTGVEIASRESPINAKQIKQVLPYARQLFDIGEECEGVAWVGSRPCFADSLPVIDRSKKHKGLWFNFGHGHVGLTAGPSSGRLMAEMICGEKPFCDPSPYRAERF